MEEVGEGGDTLGLAEVGAGVGPFLEHGAIEALDLAVGLRAVGPGAFVGDRLSERGGEDPGAVAGPVVGQYPAHGDAGGGEERVRALPERRGVSLRSSDSSSL